MQTPDETNELGQPVGFPIPGWTAPPFPSARALDGRFCRIEPLDPSTHAQSLFNANSLDSSGRNWTYLPYGPFPDAAGYRAWLDEVAGGQDPRFYAILDGTKAAVGLASYLRIQPASGSIEIGHLNFSPRLRRTPAATEALYLLLREAFALGYRRVEWKCDSLNAPSRAAAERLGFAFEGVFRQATVVKGRNRDTAWYAIIDLDWPRLDASFTRWLAPSNFDADGRQRARLSEFTKSGH